MNIFIRLSVMLLMIAFIFGCETSGRLCQEGGEITLSDDSLGDLVASELERNDVSFKRIDKDTFCYEPSFHSHVTRAVIAARSIEHPIGRIDVVLSIESEVKESLDAAGIQYTSSVQGDYLILIVDSDDLERAKNLIGRILEEKY